MKKSLFMVLSSLLLVVNVALPSNLRQTDAVPEEYAVYSALITNIFAGDKMTLDSQAQIRTLVIQDETSSDFTAHKQDAQYFSHMFPTLAEGVANDYKDKNKQPSRLKDSFDLKLPHVMIQKQEVDKIFKGGGWWEEFYKRYPNSVGFISLSRVGFNRTMNQALVYIQHGCGGLCGTGHYMLLEKRSDGWKVVNRNMVWIS